MQQAASPVYNKSTKGVSCAYFLLFSLLYYTETKAFLCLLFFLELQQKLVESSRLSAEAVRRRNTNAAESLPSWSKK